MNCLCCGKPLKKTASRDEMECGWHNHCIRSFFGTNVMPKLNVSQKELEELAGRAVNEGLTVPGVQKKLSLHLSKKDYAHLTIVNYPTGYILKPQTEEFEALPEAEDLSMRLAEAAGIQTVPHALLKMEDGYAYITKRIDRELVYEKDGQVIARLYAMEDFCQLSYRLTQDKYRGSYERCAKVIQRYSERPGLDLSELFLRVAFSFVTGNSDMHLKNFSLMEISPGARKFVLSKAYDLLPVNVILPEDKEEMALSLNGKKRNIRRKDFMILAENCSLPQKSAEKMLKQLISLEDKFLNLCEISYLPEEMKEQLKSLIQMRTARIQ